MYFMNGISRALLCFSINENRKVSFRMTLRTLGCDTYDFVLNCQANMQPINLFGERIISNISHSYFYNALTMINSYFLKLHEHICNKL